MEKQNVSIHIDDNIQIMRSRLPIAESFDLLQRDILIGGRESSFFFVDGFAKDEVMMKAVDTLLKVKEEELPMELSDFAKKFVSYIEVDVLSDIDEIVKNILSGVTCLFIDGYEACLAIDNRTYPARGVDEPEKDKSLRGSRDGFVETIVFNTALIRRRIRDEHLVMEMNEIGERSKTDVVICYLSDKVDVGLLEKIRSQLESIKVQDLRMNQQTLAMGLIRRKWYNPFPKFKFTERPDTATACLLEGKVIILVDNSPAAMVLPTSIFDMIEEANDHYFPPITEWYLKISRAIITFLTVFAVPVFLLFMQNPEWVPRMFDFVLIRDTVNIPLIFQILILELSIDGLRLAALNTPSMLSTPLSVIAGIVMGEFSVKSGWFNSEIMLYMAFVSVANYTQPNFELGYALKFMRLILLILTAIFNLPGFIAGCVIVILCVFLNKTLSGKNYLNIS